MEEEGQRWLVVEKFGIARLSARREGKKKEKKSDVDNGNRIHNNNFIRTFVTS